MDVYICYSRKERAIVSESSFALGQVGISTSVQAEGLEGGDTWWRRIQQDIIECDLVLFVLSEQTLESSYLQIELRFAREYHKHIVTARLDGNDKKTLILDAKQNAPSTFGSMETQRQAQLFGGLELEQVYSNLDYLLRVPDSSLTLAESISKQEDLWTFVEFIQHYQVPAHLPARWLKQAIDWDKQGRNPDFLLRGQELREALSWLRSQHDDETNPTPIHIAYINASFRRHGRTAIKRWLARVGVIPNNKIFISYRRDDTREICRAIYDILRKKYGKKNVFFDIDTIPPGVDFAEFVTGTLNQCSVFLAVVGSKWLDISDKDGTRRLDDPKDWVRLETATALRNTDLTVIPLLIGSVSMPNRRHLPEPLHELSFRNAFRINDDHRFNEDMNHLIEAVDEARRA